MSTSKATKPSPADANFYQLLRQQFPKDLSKPAIYDDAGVYSWADLEQGSAMIANLLQGLKLPAGSRIAVQVDKSVEAVMLYLATLRAGHVFLPLNTAYQSAEVAYFIDNAKPAVVVCSPANFGWVSKLAFQNGVGSVFTLGDNRTGSLLERAMHCAAVHTPQPVKASDLAVIIYTSGTTGRSKGAMLSHGNIASNAQTLKTYWGWRKDDVLIHALPIFHVHGLFVAIHGALLNASPMIWMKKFDPQQALVHMQRATVFMGVPTLYVRLLAQANLNAKAVRNMRLFVSGSAPLLADTFDEWHKRTGHTILERYGMSETVMLTSNPYQADARYNNATQRRGGTVGFPLPGVTLRVVNDSGESVAQGEVGHIQVQGPSVFAGYWQMPEKTAEEFTADCFFKTGDVGKIDAQGYVSIVGRNKDLIISGGYNVYPAEIESVINNLPGVAESAVVGIPHADFGEVGVAVVVARSNTAVESAQVLAALKSQLANFKVPKHCVVVADLPRNTMGKVQKNILRQTYEKAFA
ncbi:MAG: malonyl-CoA synthase [Burkholderiaceae bacterium]|nr:malonyl-CoA synthase [Burkholderiaceae bacterium]